MPEAASTRAARGFLSLAGHNPRLYVPGSLRIMRGGSMDWTERCGPRCKHENFECHIGRAGLVPTGWVDPIQEGSSEIPTPPG